MSKSKIETDIGTFSVSMSNGDHVYLNCEDATVNRVNYVVSLHLHLIDGKWTTKNWQDLYMSRRGSFDSPSPAARKKADSVLATAWESFAASAEFPAIALAADKKRLTDDIERATEKLAELDEARAALAREKAALESKLAVLTS